MTESKIPSKVVEGCATLKLPTSVGPHGHYDVQGTFHCRCGALMARADAQQDIGGSPYHCSCCAGFVHSCRSSGRLTMCFACLEQGKHWEAVLRRQRAENIKFEQALERQLEMMQRAKAAYLDSRLVTIEKNPGPELDREPSPLSATDHARKVVHILVEFLSLFGFRSEGFSTAGDVLQWTSWITDCGDWMKVAKYKFAAFYAYAQRELLVDRTLPPAPCELGHPLHLLGGKAGRFLRKQIRKSNPHRQEFLSSVLQVKTGMPRPDASALEKAALKTVQALITSRKTIPKRELIIASPGGEGRMHGLVSQAWLEEQVVRTVKETFSRAPDGSRVVVRFRTRDLLANAITPSSSANYIRSRTRKGTFGELAERTFFGQTIRPSLHVKQIHDEESRRPSVPTFHVTGFRGMRNQFLHTYFSALRAAMNELPLAEAVPLAEALKVRVITKGPALTQYCLKPVQNFMRKHMSSLPVYELTGKTIGVEALWKRLGDLGGEEAWLSGDYSDATNQMDPRLSNAAWSTFCDVCCVPNALRQLGFRVLTGHLIVESHGDDSSAALQRWGQLMGSIISFPILCFVNAAVCRAAIEHDQDREISLHDAPLMVNGDDCLLKVEPRGYAAWSKFGTMAGLSPSVGKVYYSKDFCNMNSTTFTYNDSRPEPFERVKLVRLGLVFGMKRSESASDKRGPLAKNLEALFGDGSREWDGTVGSRHRALLSECPEHCKLAAHLMFLRKNSEFLSFARQQALPWYVPACFGGVGLEPLPHLGFDASELDKKIVTAMTNPAAWNSSPNTIPQPVKIGSQTELVVHQVAMKEMKRLIGAENIERRWLPEGQSSGLAESHLFDSWAIYQRWEECFRELEDGEVSRVMSQMKQCSKTWRWYVKHAKEFAWMKVPEVLKARKLVDWIHVTEERLAALPTEEDRNWSEVDELVYGHRAMPDKDEAPGTFLRTVVDHAIRMHELRHAAVEAAMRSLYQHPHV